MPCLALALPGPGLALRKVCLWPCASLPCKGCKGAFLAFRVVPAAGPQTGRLPWPMAYRLRIVPVLDSMLDI